MFRGTDEAWFFTPNLPKNAFFFGCLSAPLWFTSGGANDETTGYEPLERWRERGVDLASSHLRKLGNGATVVERFRVS